ncbi:SHOCT domain-containing protein [Miltoncostaea marina]|uniref:SHOCT domain-containing protein n=1 Tax=Miltoncostaea marina TaxID=2843215 RepID=UPI001C3D0871|nr:SHOCT domain-containing protein [Miltoncostaea marina]
MPDPQEQMRQTAREIGQELSRALEQAARLAKAAGEDLSRLVGDARGPFGGRRGAGPHASPADAIREIARLRDEGLITEDEFQAKKTDLLSRV